MTIRCVILDDHQVVRTALSLMLNAQQDIETVGACETRDELLMLVRKERPDVLLLDIDVPGCDVFDTADDARRIQDGLHVLALTAYATDGNIERASQHDFHGFLDKSEPAEVVIDAIRKVERGEVVLSESISKRRQQIDGDGRKERLFTKLSKREMTVVTLAAEGLSMKEMGERLSRSPRTVERQLISAMKKTNSPSRVELVRWAIREGYVRP